MPNILVKVPKGIFTGDERGRLVAGLNQAAARAERIPDEPRHQALCWVIVEEVDTGDWTCGGGDVSAAVIPIFVIVHVPAGVLDQASRALYVKLIDLAFRDALPAGEKRKVATSVILNDIADGVWGAGGEIWHLPTFAARAGFEHLQHLVDTGE
jgi:phenylpyruvate tautomerase PptA (4-oxalocrotonate tautomerase family)